VPRLGSSLLPVRNPGFWISVKRQTRPGSDGGRPVPPGGSGHRRVRGSASIPTTTGPHRDFEGTHTHPPNPADMAEFWPRQSRSKGQRVYASARSCSTSAFPAVRLRWRILSNDAAD
jgi:hypothetical protein